MEILPSIHIEVPPQPDREFLNKNYIETYSLERIISKKRKRLENRNIKKKSNKEPPHKTRIVNNSWMGERIDWIKKYLCKMLI